MKTDHLPDPNSATPDELMRCYRAVLAKRAKQALQEKANGGGLPGCAPVGYRNMREEGETSVVPDEVLSPLVRLAFELAAEGSLSIRKILAEVTKRGLVSRGGKPMGSSALWGVLTNDFYRGKLRYGGQLLDGSHEPLVSRELFEQVQEGLAKRRRR